MKKNKQEWKKIKESNFNHEVNIKGQIRNVKSKKKIKPKSYSYRITIDGITKTIGSINELRWQYFKGEITSNLYFRGWKKVNAMYKNTKSYYFVNEYGDVYNAKLDRFIQTTEKKDGYLRVHIKPKEVIHHRLVGLFIPIDKKYKGLTYNDLTIDHINSIRNDNRKENLRWMTIQENLSLSHKNKNREYNKNRVYKTKKPFVSTSSTRT
jgi:hypothetical protein